MGVEKTLIKPGTGPKIVAGQSVQVHCTGFGKHGDLSQKFWSTKDRGQKPYTVEIGVGRAIRGWACNWGKSLAYGALRIMLMDQVDFLLWE